MRVLIVAAALAALMGCSACQRESVTGANVPRHLEKFIPSDATILAGVDAQGLTASPVYQRHQSELNIPLLNAAGERLGVDVRRDISHALICWRGDNALAILDGRFSGLDLQPRLTDAGATQGKYRGQTVLKAGDQLLFFPRKDVFIAGAESAVRAEIDDAGDGGVPSGLRERLKTLRKGSQIWAVSSQGFPLSRMPLDSNSSSALSNIAGYVTGATIGIAADSGIHFSADLNCVSEDGAKRVHDAMRGMIGLARLATKDDQMDLLRLYDSIQVDQDHTAVRVRSDLNADLTEKLFSYLPRVTGRADRLFRH